MVQVHFTYVLCGGRVDLHSCRVEKQTHDVLVARIARKVQRRHSRFIAELLHQPNSAGCL